MWVRHNLPKAGETLAGEASDLAAAERAALSTVHSDGPGVIGRARHRPGGAARGGRGREVAPQLVAV